MIVCLWQQIISKIVAKHSNYLNNDKNPLILKSYQIKNQFGRIDDGALQTGTPNGPYSDARTVRFEYFYKVYEIKGMRFQKDEFYFKWLEHSIIVIGKAA